MPRRPFTTAAAAVLSAALTLTMAPGSVGASASAATAPASPATLAAPTSAAPAAAVSAKKKANKKKANKKNKGKKNKGKKNRKRNQANRPRTSQATSGSLAYSPRTFVGGQALTFSGRLGVAGRKRIVLQQHMGRPGDGWFAVPGFSGSTDASGGFRFQAPAPGMFNIRYRVVAPGSRSTPSVLLAAKTQDSLLILSDSTPAPNQAFRITVDTTPTLDGRSDVRGTPAFPGRALTLQKRVDGATWQSLASTTVASNGNGYFDRTESSAGTHVYRVVQGALRSGVTQLGATASFPTYVNVGSASSRSADVTSSASGWNDWPGSSSARTISAMRSSLSGSTASGANKWGAMLWDFAWERGEGLADLPYKGTVRRGSWTEYSDGTGRASKHNGGLSLDSARQHGSVRSDRGTTMATMRDNGRAYGRWETRLRLKSSERNATDYRVRAELVPADPADYSCGRYNILIGELRPNGSSLGIGAKKGTTRWSAIRSVGSVANAAPSLAVEVQPSHVTWFFAGRAVGTVRGAASGKAMTLRLSLVGAPGAEMNQTQLISDWQRGFAAEPGRQVANGPGLTAATLSGSC